jgi:hypothetical protein
VKDFTPAAYNALLTSLADRGYAVRGYAEAEPGKRHLILRHDVDMSLEAALPIAEIEHALGLKAHYFVLLRTEMYNVFSGAARSMLAKLSALGHEIGLHLDASLYGNEPAVLQTAAEQECAALEIAAGAPVRVISFHRPAKSLLGYAETLAGRLHAYQPRFYTQIGYCSDSRGAWHHGKPLEHPAIREGRGLQLLTHPIWWAGQACSPEEKLTKFLAGRMNTLDIALADNCTIHQSGRWRGPTSN